jgi:hypothetical protein
MVMFSTRAAAALGLYLIAGTAQGALVNATFTADNHYALYSVSGQGALSFVGGNEVGADGAPGDYNWSVPESWQFNSEGVFYVAAWSDDFYAQGLLGQFSVTPGPDLGGGGALTFYTGDSVWQVYRTGLNRDDDAPHPTAGEVSVQIALANSNNAWQTPNTYQPNVDSTQPWGHIDGISNQARWIWADGAGNVFDPGQNVGEYLIFCAQVVPGPGSMALAGIAGLMLLRRPARVDGAQNA